MIIAGFLDCNRLMKMTQAKLKNNTQKTDIVLTIMGSPNMVPLRSGLAISNQKPAAMNRTDAIKSFINLVLLKGMMIGVLLLISLKRYVIIHRFLNLFIDAFFL
jgi:hypothetical protein